MYYASMYGVLTNGISTLKHFNKGSMEVSNKSTLIYPNLFLISYVKKEII